MSLRATIESVFEAVASEQKRKLRLPLSDDLPLRDSGLDSLSFALIVVRLEDKLNLDPFETVDSFPTTFGDFVKLYDSQK